MKKSDIFQYLAILGNMSSKGQKTQKLGIFMNLSDFDEIHQNKIRWTNCRLELKIWSFWQLKWNKTYREGEIKFVMRCHSTSLFSHTVKLVIFELLGVINVIGPIFANFGLNHCLNLDLIQRSQEILTWASWEPN